MQNSESKVANAEQKYATSDSLVDKYSRLRSIAVNIEKELKDTKADLEFRRELYALQTAQLEEKREEVVNLRAASINASWKSIVSAPSDGTWILAIIQGHLPSGKPFIPDVVQFTNGGWFNAESEVSDVCDSDEYKPTHWMPLPAPPPIEGEETTPRKRLRGYNTQPISICQTIN